MPASAMPNPFPSAKAAPTQPRAPSSISSASHFTCERPVPTNHLQLRLPVRDLPVRLPSDFRIPLPPDSF